MVTHINLYLCPRCAFPFSLLTLLNLAGIAAPLCFHFVGRFSVPLCLYRFWCLLVAVWIAEEAAKDNRSSALRPFDITPTRWVSISNLIRDMASTSIGGPTFTQTIPSPTTTPDNGSNETSSPLLFFVALGFVSLLIGNLTNSRVFCLLIYGLFSKEMNSDLLGS